MNKNSNNIFATSNGENGHSCSAKITINNPNSPKRTDKPYFASANGHPYFASANGHPYFASANGHPYFASANGQAMVMLVMILGSTMLGVSTIAGYITLQKIRTATDIVDSAKAIYAADSGVERCLYEKFGPGATATSTCDFEVGKIEMGNDSQVEVVDQGSVIKSIGNANRSWRAFGIFLPQFDEE